MLNVASPYTSRDEISTAMQDTAREAEQGGLAPRYVFPEGPTACDALSSASQISNIRVFNALETSQNVSALSNRPPNPSLELEGGKLDILVRTSNVKRLSDFMMWQVGYCFV